MTKTLTLPSYALTTRILMLLLALTVLAISNISAQTAADSDPEARNILDNLRKDYDSYNSLEIEFDLTLDLPDQAPEIQKGKAIQKGNQYFLELQDQAIYCDGNTVWVHLKDNNEVQINDAEDNEEEGFLTPQDMIRIYESDDYYYAVTETGKSKGKTIKKIEFKPLSDDAEYSKMRITVNTSDNKMDLMEIFSKDGSRYTLEVKSLNSNKTYAANVFAFDAKKYPGIHIEDLRF